MVGHAGVHCTVLCLGRRVLVILCLGRSELHNAMLGAWACYIILFMGHEGLLLTLYMRSCKVLFLMSEDRPYMRLEKKKGPLQNRMSHIFFNMNMRDPVLQWSIFVC